MCGVRGSEEGNCLGSWWLPGPGDNWHEACDGTCGVSADAPQLQGLPVGLRSQDPGHPAPTWTETDVQPRRADHICSPRNVVGAECPVAAPHSFPPKDLDASFVYFSLVSFYCL